MAADKTILVNRTHPVPEGFTDAIELVSVRTEDLTFLLEKETYGAFLELKQALGEAGLPVVPISGYRCHARQQEIWDNNLMEYGEEHTASYVAKPGCSEHETGMAVDVVLYDREGNEISDDEFYETYPSVVEGTPMYLRPEEREVLW